MGGRRRDPANGRLEGADGEVTILPGRDITPATISDADILLVRSITPVNESLLAGTSVQFVGTATAGVDHFDIEAIERLGVTWPQRPVPTRCQWLNTFYALWRLRDGSSES